MLVKFVDLKSQYDSIKDEIDAAIEGIISRSEFAAGPTVAEFERRFAKEHGVKYCVGVNSGTSALHLALWASDIGVGDEVIVPTNTFFATPEAVSLTGARPVFVDCDEYYNIDTESIERAITPRTKAIMPVHLYGQPCRIDEVIRIADRHNLKVIEDCAQAHLATFNGKPVGSFGLCGGFSFYPGKNLGAYGEAGAVTTNDEQIYQKIMLLRNHGSTKRYVHECVGHNYRMEGIQGAVLLAKLGHLHDWTEKRRINAAAYRRYLDGVDGIELPSEFEGARHVYHLFVVKVDDRESFIKHMSEHGIETGIHYPIPCHQQKAYASEIPQKKGSFERSELWSQKIVSLPMSSELDEGSIQYVCETIKGWLRK
jgi:dTDP-4-amino-4,6-dideoxygalactose transaminase